MYALLRAAGRDRKWGTERFQEHRFSPTVISLLRHLSDAVYSPTFLKPSVNSLLLSKAGLAVVTFQSQPARVWSVWRHFEAVNSLSRVFPQPCQACRGTAWCFLSAPHTPSKPHATVRSSPALVPAECFNCSWASLHPTVAAGIRLL